VSLDPTTGGLSFPRLLFALLRQRFTGTVGLVQVEPPGPRTIWIQGGMPVFCDWAGTDLLGDLLVERQVVKAPELERALTVLRGGGALLGEVLVDLELIDGPTRTDALRLQCTRKLSRMFAPGSLGGGAQAELCEIEHGLGDADELAQVNVLALIFAGVRAHFDRVRIEAELGIELGGDLVATPALARYERQFGFGPADVPVLSSLGRGSTFEGMLVPTVDRLRAMQLIYTLWSCQMLRVGDDAVQAIAKGATAAAAGHQLGVYVGMRSEGRAPTRAPAPSRAPGPGRAVAAVEAGPEVESVRPQSERASAPPAPAQPAAEPPARPTPSPEDTVFEARLAALETKVEAGAHAFAMFDLDPAASRKDIRAAWAELSRIFHPDALEGAERSHLRGRVEAVFAALSEAYSLLGNKGERERLCMTLELGGKGGASDDAAEVVRNAFEAEIIARDADKLLRARRYARALEIYERAIVLSPKDCDIEAALHYCRFLAGGQEVDASTTIERLAAVIEVGPNCSRAHYFKGLLHLRLDQTGDAKISLAKSATLDPRNIDAQRQLQAIKVKARGSAAKAKAEAKRGFALRDLFKK